MARASWKFLSFNTKDLELFFLKKAEWSGNARISRSKTINNLNINNSFEVHQGNTLAEINFTEFTVNKKPGMFLKTRKPFFFQTKIKKKKDK